MKLNTIPELIEDIRAGRMIVLIDDDVGETSTLIESLNPIIKKATSTV